MRTITSVLQTAAWSVLMSAGAGLAVAAPPGAGAGSQAQAQTQAAVDINKQMVSQGSGDALQAQWVARKQTFFYQGVTSHYTCDSMRDEIFSVVKKLGARTSDLKVNETGCAASPEKPSPFPGADIKMSVLEPAKDPSGSGGVPSHWRTVDLKLGDNFSNDPGTCELIAAIRKQIVPLFTTRNVESRANCFPHQLSRADQPTLKLEVLMPDQEMAKR